MPPRLKNFLYSVSMITGTIVGGGIFGIPYTFVKAGFLTGILFLVGIWLIITVLYLAYGEIVLRSNGSHQLSGYAQRYLGTWGKQFAFVGLAAGIYGALLAYPIVVGNFLAVIFRDILPFSVAQYSLAFFILVAIAILAGLRTVAALELSLSILFVIILISIFFSGLPSIQTENLGTIFNSGFWFLPYGVILFSFGGLSSVPLSREVLQNDRRLHRAIFLGTTIPLAIYFLFAILVVGISGQATTPESVIGLDTTLGHKVAVWLSLFGILTISTTFLTLGSALLEMYKYDFGHSHLFSWLLTISVPAILFLLGIRDFIGIISVAGAVSGGIEGSVLLATWRAVRKRTVIKSEYALKLSSWIAYPLVLIFIFGVIYELVF